MMDCFRERVLLALVMMSLGVTTACTREKGPIGSESNPVKLFFVPSVEAKVLEDTSRKVKTYLEANTPYKYNVGTPTSYISVVEAFGTKRADVASLNTYGYILAHQKYGVQAKLTTVRHGSSVYKAQIVARKESAINTIADLQGKKFAYVDPASTSGYLMPAKLFKDNSIEPGETVWASKHDNVISMVYQKQVDAGATFYSPPEKGEIQDARRLVKQQYPDVEDKIKIVALTEAIPNDPIVFRKDLPEEVKDRIAKALIDYIGTEDGSDAFFKLYGVTSFKESSDKDYDNVRSMLVSLGQDPQALAAKQ